MYHFHGIIFLSSFLLVRSALDILIFLLFGLFKTGMIILGILTQLKKKYLLDSILDGHLVREAHLIQVCVQQLPHPITGYNGPICKKKFP